VFIYLVELSSVGEAELPDHAMADERKGAQPKFWWFRSVGG
jgi:hypothetical protein